MTRWLEPVSKTIEDIHALNSSSKDYRRDREKALVYQEFALRRAAAIEFGRLNGWTRSRRDFGPPSIGRAQRRHDDFYLEDWEDHRICYCADRVYTAVVSQPYDKIEFYCDALDKSAAKHGLQWRLAPNPYASFHYPGRTLFIVMTMPGIEVKWLPEQAP